MSASSRTSTPPYFLMEWCLIKHMIRFYGVIIS